MKLYKLILISSLAIFCMGNTQCQHDTVVLTEGPKTTELNTEKDKQISDLKEENKGLKEKHELVSKQASLAAANFDGVLYGNEHVDNGLPKEAIKEEAELGKSRLESVGATPDPQEVIKAKDRVIAILQNEKEKVQKLYDEAYQKNNEAKNEIEKKDQEIKEKTDAISVRDEKIQTLEKESKEEKLAHLKDVQNKIEQLRKENEDKEFNWMMRLIGYGSVALILAGIVAIALTKGELWAQGGLLSLGGGLVMLVRIGYITLRAQPWFPIMCGIIFAIIVAAILWGLYRLWIKIMLARKKEQAIQDFKDESVTKGTNDFDKLKEHLQYRMGNSNSFWSKEQHKELNQAGLINKKAENTNCSLINPEKVDENTKQQ